MTSEESDQGVKREVIPESWRRGLRGLGPESPQAKHNLSCRDAWEGRISEKTTDIRGHSETTRANPKAKTSCNYRESNFRPLRVSPSSPPICGGKIGGSPLPFCPCSAKPHAPKRTCISSAFLVFFWGFSQIISTAIRVPLCAREHGFSFGQCYCRSSARSTLSRQFIPS
jgi:hypothetical protein